MAFLDKIPMPTAIMFALLLGLSPFVPEPHIWQKLKMLMDGTLVKPLDIFDLLFHGLPWLILFAKLARLAAGRGQ
ncbi:MAG TPA: RND transporter [Rhodobacteraceae bacterium]|jgi:hypothetical protein|nr:RND transporter [Paracoccaceae bacterium]